jgi:hypothetical protein
MRQRLRFVKIAGFLIFRLGVPPRSEISFGAVERGLALPETGQKCNFGSLLQSRKTERFPVIEPSTGEPACAN